MLTHFIYIYAEIMPCKGGYKKAFAYIVLHIVHFENVYYPFRISARIV